MDPNVKWSDLPIFEIFFLSGVDIYDNLIYPINIRPKN
jgi:hypothetical protein